MEDSNYKIIVSRLKTVVQRYILFGVAEAFFTALTVWCVLLLGYSLFESVLYLSPAVKEPLFFSTIGAFSVVFIVLLVVRIIRHPGLEKSSRLVERTYPHLKDRLISAVQLGRLEVTELHGQSEDLISALLRNVEEETRGLNLAQSVSSARLVLSARSVVGSISLILLITILLPGHMAGGLYRLIDFSHPYTRPGNISIYTLKRDSSIIRGENFSTPGFLSGNRFEPLNVLYRWEDSNVWSVKPVGVEKTGNFTMSIEKPRISFHYYLESGSYTTPQYRVTVIERPVVEKIDFTLSYPDYTGLGTESLTDNDGNIRALTGTRVAMTVKANKALESMTVHWSDSKVTECDVEGDTGTWAFTVTETVDYHINLVDTLKITNINPIEYRVTSLVDEEPVVTILSPAAEITLPLSMTFPVIYRAGDDYGLTSAVLRFTLPYEEETREINLKRGVLGTDIEDGYVWNMSDLGLLPDDSVSFYLAVYDNDTINGPKQGISDSVTVRVPSMTDLLTDVVDTQDKGIEKIRDISERTSQDEVALEEIRRNIISGKEMDWSDKNALEKAKNNIERVQKELGDVSESIKKAAERLSEEDMVAMETLEKFQKISEMIDEITDSELKEALKRLTQANIALDPHKIKEALDNYKVTAEDLKKKLDRIISLIEQVKSIQRFETAKRLVEEIALKQAELTEKFSNNPQDSTLWREQAKLASEMKTLEDELKAMAQDLSDKFEFNTESFEDFLEKTDIPEKMDEASGHMSKGLQEKAEKSLGESNTMLSELLAQMDALGARMQNTNTEEMKQRLFRSLIQLLAVSEKQESLLHALDTNAQSDSTVNTRDNLAKRELEIIDALSKAEQSLAQFGELFLEVAGVLEQMMASTKMSMESAVDAFATGDTKLGASRAGTSLRSINTTAHFLTMLIGSNQGSGKGMPGDLLQQLQKIANGELSLQMQMGTAESEQLMMQLAAEQQKLSEMLSELGRKISEDKRLRELLEKLTEDMDDTARMMRRNDERELIERKQLDIYRRLLDARRSRREKDDTKERKSWTAKRNISLGAEKLDADLGEKKRELNERVKRAMEDDFNAEYLRLILRYFESMLHDYDEMRVERGQ